MGTPRCSNLRNLQGVGLRLIPVLRGTVTQKASEGLGTCVLLRSSIGLLPLPWAIFLVIVDEHIFPNLFPLGLMGPSFFLCPHGRSSPPLISLPYALLSYLFHHRPLSLLH